MSRRIWSPDQLDALRRLYPDYAADVVARVLGRPTGSVHAKAAQLGLVKSEAFNLSDRSGRIQRGKQSPAMVATRFGKGQTPWNKGTKGMSGHHTNTRATQFKPGRKPEEARNYKPIGSLRISSADGYLERKVTDDPALVPARRWVAVHRLVWEAEHGPIQAGYMVVLRPGMRTSVLEQITTDRLECITRAENGRRNSPAAKNPEWARLVQLRGQITRQVNRINKEAQQRETA